MDKFIRKYNLQDIDLDKIIEIESNDRQYKALDDFWSAKKDSIKPEIFLFLIIVNALVCYQLSGRGEDYWEEFSQALIKSRVGDADSARDFFEKFLTNSANNRRFLNNKLKRVRKIFTYWNDFVSVDGIEQYYCDMNKLANKLAEAMSQRTTDKTILFAVKMFGYAGRIVYGRFVQYPCELSAPIDSRLIRLAPKHLQNIGEIRNFYDKIAKKLQVPPLHLDAVLWSYGMQDNQTLTLRAYEQGVIEYVQRIIPEVRGELKEFLDVALSFISKKSRTILEVGSGTGRDADYMESLGYSVFRTDVVQGFINLQKARGKRVVRFNILQDELGKKFDLILANAVLLHFNDKQFNMAINNLKRHMRSGGYLAIALKYGKGEEYIEDDKGNQRYFKYWNIKRLKSHLKSNNLNIKKIYKTKDNNWLYCVAQC